MANGKCVPRRVRRGAGAGGNWGRMPFKQERMHNTTHIYTVTGLLSSLQWHGLRCSVRVATAKALNRSGGKEGTAGETTSHRRVAKTPLQKNIVAVYEWLWRLRLGRREGAANREAPLFMNHTIYWLCFSKMGGKTPPHGYG